MQYTKMQNFSNTFKDQGGFFEQEVGRNTFMYRLPLKELVEYSWCKTLHVPACKV